MIHSMTGYGRSEQSINDRRITVEMRSVNHRFLEFSCRCPKSYGFLEDKLKSLIQTRAFRGKVELYVSIENEKELPVDIKVNHSLAKGYFNAVKEIADETGTSGDITAFQIARFPDVISVSSPLDENVEETQRLLWEDVKVVTSDCMC